MTDSKAITKGVLTFGGLALAVWLALVCWARPAAADTVYTNLSPSSPAYGSSGGADIDGPSSGLGLGLVDLAMAFTPSSTYELSQIDLALSYASGTNSFNITINSDSSGTPGAVLESWSDTNVPVNGSTGDVLQTFVAALPVTLTSGDQYWIEVAPGGSDTSAAWNFNNTGATGWIWQTSSFGLSNDVERNTAFDVLGTPVGAPEPSSLLLLSIGLLGLMAVVGCNRRRTHKA